MEDKIRTLEIDIETYSDVNLGDCGVYKYAESPNFEILLFGYSMSGSPVQVIDLACGEEMPERIKEAIQSKDVIKIAHNASFERICLSPLSRPSHRRISGPGKLALLYGDVCL